jgi:hypothetical protein
MERIVFPLVDKLAVLGTLPYSVVYSDDQNIPGVENEATNRR